MTQRRWAVALRSMLPMALASAIGVVGVAPAGAVSADDFLNLGRLRELQASDQASPPAVPPARELPVLPRRPTRSQEAPELSTCTPQPVSVPVTAVSFNIRFGRRDGRSTLEEIAGILRGSGADIVLLQEVDRFRRRSGYRDQAAWLAGELGMQHVFGANVLRSPEGRGQPRSEYGLAILSRFPIVEADNTLLPNRKGLEQRGLLRARLDIDGWTLDVYNTHWQHTSGAVRQDQARAVARVLAGNTFPHILGGDLNAKPGTPEVRTLTESLTDTYPTAGLGAGATAPASRPGKRIDYLMHSDPITVAQADVLATGRASDHLPVRAVYAFPALTLCVPGGVPDSVPDF